MNSGTPLQYKGLNGPPTDNEDEDYPPQFHLLHEQDKSKWPFSVQANTSKNGCKN